MKFSFHLKFESCLWKKNYILQISSHQYIPGSGVSRLSNDVSWLSTTGVCWLSSTTGEHWLSLTGGVSWLSWLLSWCVELTGLQTSCLTVDGIVCWPTKNVFVLVHKSKAIHAKLKSKTFLFIYNISSFNGPDQTIHHQQKKILSLFFAYIYHVEFYNNWNLSA